MGNSVVGREFEHFWINHDHPHIFWGRLVENAEHNRVNTDRFTGAGCPSDQYMGHLAKIRNHRLPGNILAQNNGERALAVLVDLRRESFKQEHGLPTLVRDLKADVCFPGDILNHANTHNG